MAETTKNIRNRVFINPDPSSTPSTVSPYDESAALQIDSTSTGFLHPRMTTSQRDAISSPAEGLTVYNTTSSTVDYFNGSTWEQIGSGTGSGQGFINYVGNNDFEDGVGGYTTYKDAAQSTPENGSGGAPTITITQTNTDPLRDSFSGLITKDAADRQGEGVAISIPVLDRADQNQILEFSFDYEVSANFAIGQDSDVQIFVINTDNSNELLELSNQTIDFERGTFRGAFRTNDIPFDNYRPVFHIATTNALAWTMKIDNVFWGPKQPLVLSPKPQQTKNLLSSDVSSTGVMSDLTFTGLQVGKKYALSGQVNPIDTGGNFQQVQFLIEVDNGSDLIGRIGENLNGNGLDIDDYVPYIPFYFEFEATDSTLTFNLASRTNVNIRGDGTTNETFAVLRKIQGPATVLASDVGEWTSFTPTGTWTTNTTYSGLYRQVGDELQLRVYWITSGAPTTANFDVNLPSGFTIDTSKLPNGADTDDCSLDCTGAVREDGAAQYQIMGRFVDTTTIRLFTYGADQVDTQLGVVAQNAPFTWGANDAGYFFASVPIVRTSGLPVNVIYAETTKFQTKTLSSPANSTGVVSDLTFNNLKIGRTYRIGGQIRWIDVGSNLNNIEGVIEIDNGSTLVGRVRDRIDDSGSGLNIDVWIRTSFPNILFTATDTSLTFDITTINDCELNGDGTRAETFITLEEIPNIVETDEFT